MRRIEGGRVQGATLWAGGAISGNRRRFRALRGAFTRSANQENANTDEDRTMTALQYLLSQAEHCRRVAEDTSDPFIAEEMQRLASDFERRARASGHARRDAPFPVVRPAEVQIAAQ